MHRAGRGEDRTDVARAAMARELDEFHRIAPAGCIERGDRELFAADHGGDPARCALLASAWYLRAEALLLIADAAPSGDWIAEENDEEVHGDAGPSYP